MPAGGAVKQVDGCQRGREKRLLRRRFHSDERAPAVAPCQRILQAVPEAGRPASAAQQRFLSCPEGVGTLAGKAGGRQGQAGAEHPDVLFPETVDGGQFREREDVAVRLPVVEERGHLIRREQTAFEQPGARQQVDGQGMTQPVRQPLHLALVQVFCIPDTGQRQEGGHLRRLLG